MKSLFETQCAAINKKSLITLKILPSIDLTGSLQISETMYWYNVNNGKICKKILGHLAINVIKGTIIEMYIAIIHHKSSANTGVLLSLSRTTTISVMLYEGWMCKEILHLAEAKPSHYLLCDSQCRKWSFLKLFCVWGEVFLLHH